VFYTRKIDNYKGKDIYFDGGIHYIKVNGKRIAIDYKKNR